MQNSISRTDHRLVIAAWLTVLIALAIMAATLKSGSDAGVYERTVQEVRSGLSPYASGVERLRIDHELGRGERTLNYIYPPVTLLLVQILGSTDTNLRICGFWLLYAAGTWIVLRMEQHLLLGSERRIFQFLTPLCVFFPGLLNDDYFLAGNVAPILYGLVTVAAISDWKRKHWRWFYLTVLLVSLFKPPMLTLLAIPVLTATGQWLKTAGAGILGCAMFFLQRFIWPDTFRTYVQMMDLEVLYNNELGFGPAGLLGKFLLDHHLPYKDLGLLFYGCYAAAAFWVLLCCARHYLAGRISAAEWMPTLLIGVVLLNPRIKQYDAAAITLPLAMVAWRLLATTTRTRRTAMVAGMALFVTANLLAAIADAWNLLEMMLTVIIFTVSTWDLLRRAKSLQYELEDIAEMHLVAAGTDYL